MEIKRVAGLAKLKARDKELSDAIEAKLAGGSKIIDDDEFDKLWHEQLQNIDDQTALRSSSRSDALKALEVNDPVSIKPAFSPGIRGDRRKQVLEASTNLSKLSSNPALDSTVAVDGKGGKRANYGMDGTIHLDKYSGQSTYSHELGHFLEDKDPWVHQQALEFYDRRTKGESLRQLGDRFRSDEQSRPDKFFDPYIGKDYGVYANGRRYATEVISMGLEHYYRDPVGFAKKDPEHFDLIYMALRGVQ